MFPDRANTLLIALTEGKYLFCWGGNASAADSSGSTVSLIEKKYSV